MARWTLVKNSRGSWQVDGTMQTNKTQTVVAKLVSGSRYEFTIPAEMTKRDGRIVVQFPYGEEMVLVIQPRQGTFIVEQPIEAKDISVSFG
jgi:hypothetical protein